MNSPVQLAPKRLASERDDSSVTRTVSLHVSPPSVETTYEWSSNVSLVYGRPTKPTWTKSPEASIHWKNWSDFTDSWLILTGRLQVSPSSSDRGETMAPEP